MYKRQVQGFGANGVGKTHLGFPLKGQGVGGAVIKAVSYTHLIISRDSFADDTAMANAYYIPVSYTHLDVYKRQALGRGGRGVLCVCPAGCARHAGRRKRAGQPFG